MRIKKQFALLLLVISFHTFCFAQNQGINNNWLMGYQSAAGWPGGQTHFDFYTGSLAMTYDSLEMDFRHTHTNISDSLGNMLFYTNGYYIADATNDTMQNGGGLSPGAYAANFSYGFMIPQGALVIKKPGSNSIYYLFHNSVDNYLISNNSVAFQLYKTEIDMSLNNGKGAVTSKNVPVITDTLNCGKIAACKTANGRDWWVMVHRANSDMFYKLLVTPTAILSYTQNAGTVRQWDAGQSWFSPDGTKYAYFYINGGLDIFDFDRCSGMLSNPVHITIPFESGYNVGMAISPGSNALYVSNVYHIYQYDLTAANIPSTQTIVATYDSFLSVIPGFPGFPTVFGLASLAPDGKIYITTGNGTVHIHTIDNPDVIGVGCNVNQHSLQLSSIYFNTLPNHPNYFLGCDSTTGCTTCYTGIVSNSKDEIKARAVPNPSNGIFTLQFPVESANGELEVYDVMGNLVMKEYVAAWSQFKYVDISKFSSGIYLCKLKWGNGISGSVKVIKE